MSKSTTGSYRRNKTECRSKTRDQCCYNYNLTFLKNKGI